MTEQFPKTIDPQQDRTPTLDRVQRILAEVPIPPRPDSLIPIRKPELDRMPKPAEYAFPRVVDALQQQADETGRIGGGVELVVTEAPENIDADLGVAVHKLAKHFRKSPQAIAEDLALNVNAAPQAPHITKASADGGYLNFEIDKQSLGNEILTQVETMGERYGEQNIGNGDTVIIDCSSPNIAKYMSVGHLRSTVIGESLARIYESCGFTAIRDNHLGDWGTQFGMLGRAYELWGEEIPELTDGSDPVKGLYKLYVKMHEEIEHEKEENSNNESSLEVEGKAWFARLENGDPEAKELWSWSLSQSLKEFQRVYDLLGSKFEYTLGESFYIGMLPSVIDVLQKSGVASKDEKGAVAVPLEDEKLNRLVVQKSDGTSLYASRDLATLMARTEWFKPAKMLYVVGGDQTDYFRQVFATFHKLMGDEGPDVEHIAFGMVSLPEGKMSTRRGRVVFLEDVLSEAIARADIKMKENGRNFDAEEEADIARKVGVGAVIYSDLGQGRERGIKFDLDKALSLESNSAPYIQYAHARATAVLRRANEAGHTVDRELPAEFGLPTEKQLIMHLGKLSATIQRAMNENQPSIIAEYTYKAADLFNKFYNAAHILTDNESERNSRLRLTEASAQVIKNSLNLLGIEAPQQM